MGTAAYDVFGAVRSQSGLTSPLGFTGERVTPQTGLVHLRARDYAPGLGRFLSVDAVQPNAPGTQGYNLYAYVANNPTSWVDPSGHTADTHQLAVHYYQGLALLLSLYATAQVGNSPALNQAAMLVMGVFLIGVACGMTPGCVEQAQEAAGWAAELGSAAVAGKWTWLAGELSDSARWTTPFAQFAVV